MTPRGPHGVCRPVSTWPPSPHTSRRAFVRPSPQPPSVLCTLICLRTRGNCRKKSRGCGGNAPPSDRLCTRNSLVPFSTHGSDYLQSRMREDLHGSASGRLLRHFMVLDWGFLLKFFGIAVKQTELPMWRPSLTRCKRALLRPFMLLIVCFAAGARNHSLRQFCLRLGSKVVHYAVPQKKPLDAGGSTLVPSKMGLRSQRTTWLPLLRTATPCSGHRPRASCLFPLPSFCSMPCLQPRKAKPAGLTPSPESLGCYLLMACSRSCCLSC